jgi:hypothetical protein
MTARSADRMTDTARERVREQLASGSDDTNPAYVFSTTHTALLLAMESGTVDAANLARAELANRGLDADGNWCGFDRAREIHLGATNDQAPNATAEPAVAEIARRSLHLDTLDTRNSDALDFHDLAVWSIREALVAAYNAGRTAGGRQS